MSGYPYANRNRLFCFYYGRAPIRQTPPNRPLPSYDHAPLYYGELSVQYRHTTAPYRLRLGHTLLAEFQFSMILNELAKLPPARSDRGSLDLAQVLHYHHLFEEWFSELPRDLAPDQIVFPHHLKVQ